MDDEQTRRNLDELIRRTPGESYSSVSKLLGRNAAYVQQYVKRGSPARLDEQDRALLGRYFGVDPASFSMAGAVAPPSTIQVPQMSVQASAGPGRIVDDEFVVGAYGFDPNWLQQVSRARPGDLSIITVSGDSMAPTLMDGDDVLVDRSSGERLRDGIYVLRRDDTLLVKRLALAPTSGTLTISSDNPAYPSWHDCPLSSIDVVGRVVWAGRRFG